MAGTHRVEWKPNKSCKWLLVLDMVENSLRRRLLGCACERQSVNWGDQVRWSKHARPERHLGWVLRIIFTQRENPKGRLS